MHGVEAHVRVRMQDLGTGNPTTDQQQEPRPGHPVMLAPPPERTVPTPDHLSPKAVQTIHIAGHCMIVEVALYDGLQPPPNLGHWLVPAPPKLLLQLTELGRESLTNRLSLDDE